MKNILFVVVLALSCFVCSDVNAQVPYGYGNCYGYNFRPYYYYVYPNIGYFNSGTSFSVYGNRLNLQFYNFSYPQFNGGYYTRPNRMPGSHYFPPTPHPSNNWSRNR